MAMKKILLSFAALLFALLPEAAPAQTVTTQPAYIDSNGGVTDFGNGPLEFKIVTGSAYLFTSSSSSTATAGTSGSPNLTVGLNLNPAPLVGAIVSGVGVTSGTTVVSYTAGTGVIVLSANLTANASGVYSFGTACPTSYAGVKAAGMGVGQPPGDLPFYTQARICGYAGFGAGASVMSFAIGAH